MLAVVLARVLATLVTSIRGVFLSNEKIAGENPGLKSKRYIEAPNFGGRSYDTPHRIRAVAAELRFSEKRTWSVGPSASPDGKVAKSALAFGVDGLGLRIFANGSLPNRSLTNRRSIYRSRLPARQVGGASSTNDPC